MNLTKLASALVLLTLCAPARAGSEISESLEGIVGKPGGLTADEVARRSVATSTELKAARLETGAADSRLHGARARWAPLLNLSARYARYSPYEQPVLGPFVAAPGTPPGPVPAGTPLVNAPGTFPAFVNNYNLQAQVIVPISDYVFRVSQGVTAARQSVQASKLQERATQLAIAAQARLLYYAWVRSKLTERVADQQVVDARTQLEKVRAAEGLGRATRVDVLAAEARLAASESSRDQAASMERRLQAELHLAMHETGSERYEIGENLEPEDPAAAVPPLAVLYREAEDQRVDLAAALAAQRAASHRTDVERAKAYPRLDAFFNGYYANPNMRFLPPQDEFRGTWDAGVQLTWTPNEVFTTRAEVRAQEAEVARLGEERRVLAEALRREVVEAREELARVKAVKAGSEARLSAAEAAYRARQEAFDLGRATFSDVITAQTEMLLARLAYIDTQVGLKIAEVRLEHAVGRDAAPSRATPPTSSRR